MSYKDKVKKAMELIEENKPKVKYCIVWDLITPIALKYKINLEKDIIYLSDGKYAGTYLCYSKNLKCICLSFITYGVTKSNRWLVCKFPHIKTLQQFEDLYKALAGKELGDE